MTDLRYPIGKFVRPTKFTPENKAQFIQAIKDLPQILSNAIEGLDDTSLDTPYREGGWTVRQVVHHVADSHLNSYVRFRLALTEQEPAIKVYDENTWAALPDAKHAPVSSSLALLDGLHQRWTLLLESFTADDWKRAFVHPKLGPVPLEVATALYAWHGEHHVAHITSLRERQGWD